MSNYNRSIPTQFQFGYSNVCAYPQFIEYCLSHNLSAQEIAILQYILCNSKEWEISPTQIANKFNFPRQSATRSLTKLVKKLNGDLVIPSRSNSSNGSLVNAEKVYDTIYNMIVSVTVISVTQPENNTTEQEEPIDETNDKQSIEVGEMPVALRCKYQQYLNSPSWSKDNLISWLKQNHIQYRIGA